MKIRPHNQQPNTNEKQTNYANQNNAKPITRLNARKKKLLEKENVPPNPHLQSKDNDNKNEKKSLKIKKDLMATIEGEYEKEILAYLKSTETSFQIESNYLRNHKNISHQTRSVFVKYFFEVSRKFKLKRKTLFLAVYYMDSYFSKCLELEKKEAIISAQACLFMAMKYSEIYPPDLCEWTRPVKEIVLAEGQILKKLDFNLSYTSIEDYLEFYFSKFEIDEEQTQMIRLIADVSAFDDKMYSYSPSQLSLSIILSISEPTRLDEEIGKSLKWMLERNESHLGLLQGFAIKGKVKTDTY